MSSWSPLNLAFCWHSFVCYMITMARNVQYLSLFHVTWLPQHNKLLPVLILSIPPPDIADQWAEWTFPNGFHGSIWFPLNFFCVKPNQTRSKCNKKNISFTDLNLWDDFICLSVSTFITLFVPSGKHNTLTILICWAEQGKLRAK